MEFVLSELAENHQQAAAAPAVTAAPAAQAEEGTPESSLLLQRTAGDTNVGLNTAAEAPRAAAPRRRHIIVNFVVCVILRHVQAGAGAGASPQVSYFLFGSTCVPLKTALMTCVGETCASSLDLALAWAPPGGEVHATLS